jgi:hypothetical protein
MYVKKKRRLARSDLKEGRKEDGRTGLKDGKISRTDIKEGKGGSHGLMSRKKRADVKEGYQEKKEGFERTDV